MLLPRLAKVQNLRVILLLPLVQPSSSCLGRTWSESSAAATSSLSAESSPIQQLPSEGSEEIRP